MELRKGYLQIHPDNLAFLLKQADFALSKASGNSAEEAVMDKKLALVRRRILNRNSQALQTVEMAEVDTRVFEKKSNKHEAILRQRKQIREITRLCHLVGHEIAFRWNGHIRTGVIVGRRNTNKSSIMVHMDEVRTLSAAIMPKADEYLERVVPVHISIIVKVSDKVRPPVIEKNIGKDDYSKSWVKFHNKMLTLAAVAIGQQYESPLDQMSEPDGYHCFRSMIESNVMEIVATSQMAEPCGFKELVTDLATFEIGEYPIKSFLPFNATANHDKSIELPLVMIAYKHDSLTIPHCRIGMLARIATEVDHVVIHETKLGDDCIYVLMPSSFIDKVKQIDLSVLLANI